MLGAHPARKPLALAHSLGHSAAKDGDAEPSRANRREGCAVDATGCPSLAGCAPVPLRVA
eukprot:8594068-Alexandrium_andersonii.AAC.1